jgi:hypothetical protein
MKKILLSVLSVGAVLAALCVSGCGTEPRGTEGKISLSDSLHVGTKGAVTVTLKDADLTDTVATVKVISTADQLGITLKLTGKNGVYTGSLAFTTDASSGNAIQVSNNCLVTVTYKDAFPAGTKTQTLFWKAGTMSVKLDNTSYKAIYKPMVITVTDTNIDKPSVTVTVATTSYPNPMLLTCKLLAGSYGVYVDTVYFTASTSLTGKDTVHVKSGDSVFVSYSDALVPVTLAPAAAKWTAIMPMVAPGAPVYTGVKDKIVINVLDSNVSVPSVTVHLKSAKDTAGIDVVLKAVKGSTGSYTAMVGVSLTQSVQGSVIAVLPPNDTMTITYVDPAIAAPILGTALQWQAAPVSISLDSSAYHGTAETMMITAADDHTTADSIVVNVISKLAADTVQITLRLDSTSNFSGKVGFSMGAKTATAVGVKDSDLVTVSYVDNVKNDTPSVSANWYSTQIAALGILGTNATPGATQVPAFNPGFFTWSGTCTVDSAPNFAGNGNTVRITAGTVGWAGFGWTQVDNTGALTGINMTAYDSSSLHVRLKGNASGIKILVENAVHTGQTFIPAANYGYVNDEQWHEIVIPLSAWAATCDLSGVSYFMGATFDPYVAGQYIVIDDLYWTLPAATVTPTAKRLSK